MAYSVLMSVYQKEKPEWFRLAVQSMLDQTVRPDEVVLVCDGPLTSELDKVITEFCHDWGETVRVHRLPENRGLGLALKAGLEICSHEIVARMDTDDVAAPDRMERQLAVLEADETISAVGGQIAEFTETPERIMDYRCVPLTHSEIVKRIASRNPMNHVTVTFRKSHVEKAGSYQDFLWFEDYHLWARMIAAGCRFANLPDTAVYVRIDENVYKRRAGLPYFRQTVKMQNFLLQQDLITRLQYAKNTVLRFCGTVLCPNWLRAGLYKSVLRKS